MKNLIVLNECGFSEEQKKRLGALVYYTDTDSEDLAIERIKGADADTIIMDQFMFTFGEKLLKACPNLKKIIVNTTAFDRLPINLLTPYGVELKNLPAYATEDVAETALSMILQLNQRTSLAQDLAYRWGVSDIIPGSRSAEIVQRKRLQGQVAAIVGMGKIGSQIFRSLNMLDVNPWPFNRTNFQTLKDVIPEVDILVIAMSYQPGENDKIISAQILEALKDEAIIVSVAPSELIDLDWLIAHPDKFAGIGFDYLVTPKVWELLKVRGKNTIITPHLGSQSKEAMENMTEALISLV